MQDVAFFDGNTSGQLTSRLSHDANNMVSPIQVRQLCLYAKVWDCVQHTMMFMPFGRASIHGILLIGGIHMCAYTHRTHVCTHMHTRTHTHRISSRLWAPCYPTGFSSWAAYSCAFTRHGGSLCLLLPLWGPSYKSHRYTLPGAR